MLENKSSDKTQSEELFASFQKLREALSENIVGQKQLIDEILASLLASGHILITGAPGLAKTTIIKTLSQYLGLSFGRIQFTPDLLPTDITGSDVFNVNAESSDKTFSFQKGPIFANIVLADEINRASPRTQSALLEAMQEKKVTFGNKTHALPNPFIVCATQNPFESEGVFPLPEAQLDRFLIHSIITYPERNDEIKVLDNFSKQKLPDQKNNSEKNILSIDNLKKLSNESQKVEISEELIDIIYELTHQTRTHVGDSEKLIYGAGTRAGMSLIAASKSIAFMEKSKSVSWGHLQKVIKPCLRHRVKLNSQAYYEGYREDIIIEEIINTVKEKFHNKVKGL